MAARLELPDNVVIEARSILSAVENSAAVEASMSAAIEARLAYLEVSVLTGSTVTKTKEKTSVDENSSSKEKYDKCPFSEQVREGFSKTLGVPREDAEIIEKFYMHLIEESERLQCSGKVLATFLNSKACGFSQEHARAMGKAWSNRLLSLHTGSLIVEPPRLRHVDWDTGIHLANSYAYKLAIPYANLHMQLKCKKDQHKSKQSFSSLEQGRESTSLSLSFSHDQLFDFFQQLEEIQSKLDML